LKWMPAEYAKLKQLKRITVSNTSFSIRLANEYREGAHFLQKKVQIYSRKATEITAITISNITLQLRRKFAS
jgi:hypothetical protein